MKTTFIGLGRMGAPMAKRLIDAGFQVGVYNRSREKTEPFLPLKCEIHPDLKSALKGCDLLFTMLSDDSALLDVLNGKTSRLLNRSSIHVSHSTVSPGVIKKTETLLNRRGGVQVCAPVMGRPEAAAAGALKVLLAGPDGAKETIRPYLAPLGEVFDFGSDPSSALIVKLGFNFMIAAAIETLSEAFTFVENNGVNQGGFFRLVTETLFSAPAFKTYGDIILKGDFDQAGFPVALGRKDLGLVTAQALETNSTMPIASVAETRLGRALNLGWGEKDWCCVSDIQRAESRLHKRKKEPVQPPPRGAFPPPLRRGRKKPGK
ncbi:MAG: NAD(P)-dependent oxidoreductase [Deltaproteobacteria bacterium]|jgi:3-hydroxyisobutyrate dehydrogenase-like beta-hydroxyacid dehydrogenase|nr:NAD(P)-dependent oxidoreductase [Deltaproteobacteria bacterium]